MEEKFFFFFFEDFLFPDFSENRVFCVFLFIFVWRVLRFPHNLRVLHFLDSNLRVLHFF